MTEFEPPTPGWWQASEGNWYPPEAHPDYEPPTPMPVDVPPPPSPGDIAGC